MLSRDQCERYEAILLHEISKRRSLGGYSPDAGSLLTLCEICYEIVRDRREKMPMPKKKKLVEVDDD